MSLKHNFYKGLFWFAASLVIGVLLDVIQKHLGSDLHSMQVTFLRFLFAALILLPVLIINSKRTGCSMMTKYWKVHIFRGILLFAGMSLWCYGLMLVPISTAIVINYSIPFFTLILSMIFLKETVTKGRWNSTFLGFIGILIVLNPAKVDFDVKILSLLASSFLFASLDVVNKKYVCVESMINMLFYTALLASAFSLVPAVANWNGCVFRNVGLLLALGLGANVLFYCLLKAFKYVDASALAPFRYMDFFVSVLFGMIFFLERPSNDAIIGFLIIVPNTLYLAYNEGKKNQKTESADNIVKL